MKKLFILIAAITLMASNSSAQDNATISANATVSAKSDVSNNSNVSNNVNDSRDGLHLGLKIGLNVSNVYDTQGQQFTADAKAGLAVGAFLTIPIGTYLGVQPEIMFSQKGYQTSNSIFGFGYKYTHTANFIDVPLLVAFKPIPYVTILAGPQYSFLISEKNAFTNTIFSDPLIQKSDFDNSNVRKNIFGFVVGGDINLSLLVIGLRAGWDITNNNGDGTQTTPRYKNVYYQGTIGFRL